MTAVLVDIPLEQWDGGDMPDEERPLMVARPLTESLDRIQLGVDKANEQLALKADKVDLEAAKRQLHTRIDEVQHDLAGVKQDVAQGKGWRDGVLLGIGLAAGLVGALVFYIVTH